MTTRRGTRFWLRTILYTASAFTIVLGTLVIFTFDPSLGWQEPRMQIHSYDVVIVGAGGAGMRAAWSPAPGTHGGADQALPTRSHRRGPGRHVRRAGQRGGGQLGWYTFDTIKGGDYLVDQDAAEIVMQGGHRRGHRPGEDGSAVQPHPEGRIDQRRFGGHTCNHGEAAVRRACYAADRTGHMILQTLYQNCIKQGIEFYNEFYVLDVLLDDSEGAPRGGGGGLRTGNRRDPRLPGEVDRVRHRRVRQGLQDDLQRSHPHR